MSDPQNTIEAISQLRTLPDNWDSYGSPAIRAAALDSAQRVVSIPFCAALPAPHVSPVAGGGVGLTWQNASRELLIELLPDGSAEYLAVETDSEDGGEKEVGGSLNPLGPDALQPWFAWLCKG